MLSDTIKYLREKCGYTQQQVADALSIDRSTYTYYETSKTTPSVMTIVKLAKIFNVHYSCLIDTINNDEFPSVSEKKYSYSTKQNTTSLHELSKDERKLIANFRLLSEEKKQDLIDKLNNDKVDF